VPMVLTLYGDTSEYPYCYIGVPILLYRSTHTAILEYPYCYIGVPILLYWSTHTATLEYPYCYIGVPILLYRINRIVRTEQDMNIECLGFVHDGTTCRGECEATVEQLQCHLHYKTVQTVQISGHTRIKT
jgi:hypothetical protein